MNSSTKLMLTAGVLLSASQTAYAYTFKFHNNLYENLTVKMQLIGWGEPEESINVPTGETREKSFDGFRIGLAPNYIKLIRANSADKIDPRRLCVTRAEFDRAIKIYGNMWFIDEISQALNCPAIGNMEFEIVQDSKTGELILVQIFTGMGLIQ